jgi:hypothetical protein
MITYFNRDNLKDYKSFEELLLKEYSDNTTLDELNTIAINRSLESLGIELSNDSLNELTMSVEGKTNDVDVKKGAGWLDIKNLTNKEKIAIGERDIYDGILKIYKDNFNSTNTQISILKFIQNYIVRNLENLSTKGPTKRVPWNDSDKNEYFIAAKVDEKDIKKILKESKAVDPKWFTANNPLFVLNSILAHFYYNNPIEKEAKLPKESTLLYSITLITSIRMYSSKQLHSFPYLPDEDLMDQVMDDIAHKHNLKKTNNVLEMLQYISYTNVENMIETLKNPVDFNINYFMNNLYNRINYYIKSIAREFYKYHNEGKKVGSDNMFKEDPEKEGEMYVDVPQSISNDIETITRKIILKLSTESDLDAFCVDASAKRNKVNKEKAKISIIKMKNEYPDLVGNLIRNVLAYYLSVLKQKKQTIKSTKFVNLMDKAYTVSNTNNIYILEIKKILDDLLEKCSEEFQKTSRLASKSNLRGFTYFYFILYLAKYC